MSRLLLAKFHQVLLIAAVLIFAVASLEWLLLDVLLVPPFVFSFLLLVLAAIGTRWPKPVAGISIMLAILIPIGATLAYLNGDIVIAIPIFDAVLFAWVAYNAIHALRSG